MLNKLDMTSHLSVRTVTRTGLAELLPHWQDLCSRCSEDNVYFLPHYALALLDTVAKESDVVFVTVWDGSVLIGLLPVSKSSLAVPGIIAGGQAWETDYTFNSMPLLDRVQALGAAAGLVDGLAQLRAGEWIIPNVNTGGPACQALISALELRQMPYLRRGAFQRASMTGGRSFEDHLAACIDSKRRRELARNRRRLEELGVVTYEAHQSGGGLRQAVEAFLRLEASGWKGQRGTALLNRLETKEFAINAFAGKGKTRVDLLLVNGTPIAAGVTLFAGTTGFTVKCAYDEAYAKYSAGLLLELDVIKSFLVNGWAQRLDAATNGVHVIDRLWPDRIEVADLVFSLAPIVPRARLAAFDASQKGFARVKSVAKHWLGR